MNISQKILLANWASNQLLTVPFKLSQGERSKRENLIKYWNEIHE